MLIRVLLRPLKCIAIYLKGSVENPWVKCEKNGRKKKGEETRPS
jgi:hypothetical protein